MSTAKSITVFVGFIAVSVAVVIVISNIGYKYLTANDPSKAGIATCQGQHSSHHVSIRNNTVQPQLTQAKLCETLTITNNDNAFRLIAFGPHAHHVEYDGVAQKELNQGDSLTITLNKAGVYDFHDHLDYSVSGDFIVSK